MRSNARTRNCNLECACPGTLEGKFKSILLVQFSSSQADLDQLLSNTRTSTDAYLHLARELSLLRHSLVDELSSLSDDFTSALSGGGSPPTLLEDIETLHRNLKELQSVKGYVQVIDYALRLR